MRPGTQGGGYFSPPFSTQDARIHTHTLCAVHSCTSGLLLDPETGLFLGNRGS